MGILLGINITELLNTLNIFIENFLTNIGIWGGVLGCVLIMVESIIPILPLCVFITLVFYTFGNFIGFLISWFFTCVGCALSFLTFRFLFRKWFRKKFIKVDVDNFTKKLMKRINRMKLSSLAMLVAIPFTPAFAVNIVASQSDISFKKFIVSMAIGKMFMVYFWGYIGTTLLECFSHPIYLLKIVIMILLAFVISKLVNKYLKLD